jgi:large subunit ribosomal protein L29
VSGAKKRGLDAGSIREMTVEEIQERIAQLEEEQFRLRFRSATQQLENPMLVRHIRRDVARLKTMLTERNNATTGGR